MKGLDYMAGEGGIRMLTLIKGGEVYASDYLGKKDILLVGGKIGYIRDEIAIQRIS